MNLVLKYFADHPECDFATCYACLLCALSTAFRASTAQAGNMGQRLKPELYMEMGSLGTLTPILHRRSPAVSVPSESVVDRANSDRNSRSDVSKYSKN
jgi:hypothetical protein